jgi:hypothetical protein
MIARVPKDYLRRKSTTAAARNTAHLAFGLTVITGWSLQQQAMQHDL